jgi:hypothetical protein
MKYLKPNFKKVNYNGKGEAFFLVSGGVVFCGVCDLCRVTIAVAAVNYRCTFD